VSVKPELAQRVRGFQAQQAAAQGCVAIRSMGGFCSSGTEGHVDTASKWQLSVNNRYFKSYKHFVGTNEQKQRQTAQSEVINHQYTTDLTLFYQVQPRWSLMLDLPIEANTRSSLYEHASLGRFQTHSFGVGDIRLAVYGWVLDPLKMPKGDSRLNKLHVQAFWPISKTACGHSHWPRLH